MKNFFPSENEINEALMNSSASIQETKARLTIQHVVAEIRSIYDGNPFSTHDRIKRLCQVLDFMIRTGAISFKD